MHGHQYKAARNMEKRASIYNINKIIILGAEKDSY
jgi:hypothetical protein